MNDGTGLQYFLTDHPSTGSGHRLGSVVATTDSNGTLTSQQRYLPFGGVRADVPSPNVPATDYGYTGQRNLDSNIGLMDYKARFYSPYLNRFIQPDNLIPSPANPQAFNRYTYVMNSPTNFNDPTGHMCEDPEATTARGGGIQRCDSGKVFGGKQHGDKSHGNGLGIKGSGRDSQLINKEIGGFYVGPNAPKDLWQYEESAYGIHGMNTVPSVPAGAFADTFGVINDYYDFGQRRNNQSNVSVSASFNLYSNGSIDVVSLTIVNASEQKIFLERVKFTASGNPVYQMITTTCNNLNQCYIPSPARIVPSGNDSGHFSAIDPKSIEIVPLTPSGYPLNPNNHFGPQSIQSVTIRLDFRFTIAPGMSFIQNTLIP